MFHLLSRLLPGHSDGVVHPTVISSSWIQRYLPSPPALSLCTTSLCCFVCSKCDGKIWLRRPVQCQQVWSGEFLRWNEVIPLYFKPDREQVPGRFWCAQFCTLQLLSSSVGSTLAQLPEHSLERHLCKSAGFSFVSKSKEHGCCQPNKN